MKILYLVLNPERLSGSNKSLLLLISNLPISIRPNVIIPYRGMLYHALVERKIPVSSLFTNPYKSILGKFFQLFCFFIYLSFNFLKIRPDILHTNDVKSTLFFAWFARVFSCEVIAHVRGRLVFSRSTIFIFEKLVNKIILVANALNQELSEYGKAKSIVIYNPVEEIPCLDNITAPEWFIEIRKSYQHVILTMASYVPFKGIHHVLAALNELKQRSDYSVAYVVIGDTIDKHINYKNELNSYCDEHDLDMVYLKDWVDSSHVILGKVDLCILPSVDKEKVVFGNYSFDCQGSEGFPRFLLEAISHGVPVIANDTSGISELIIDGETGLLCVVNDSQRLSIFLESCFEDMSVLRKISTNAKQVIGDKYSINKIMPKILSVYQEVLQK